jgi:8-oxo-dGTP pyrophosphatase MutT (NUDIX family)
VDYLKTIEWIRVRLESELPGEMAHERMMARVKEMPRQIPADARPSAVLCVLFPVKNELSLLLIQRTEDGRAHSGQISLPGGKQDPGDADLRATALREVQEEVGIMSKDIAILGQLTPLYIPVSNFQVYPFVGFCEDKPRLHLNKNEVAQAFEVPLSTLLSKETKTISRVISPIDPEFVRNVNAYQLNEGPVIWGATAMILSELEVILSEQLPNLPLS